MSLPNARDMVATMAARRQREQDEKRSEAEKELAERSALHAAFLEREVAPDAMDRIGRIVRRAAERGEYEVEVLRFPADWMLDKGRSLTSGYGDWTKQLDGFAARGEVFFREHLAPLGYAITAGIVDYKDGLPGDVAVTLSWKPTEPS